MERYWDALRCAGWVPDSVGADAWKQWSCGANILPSLAEWWGRDEPNLRPAHRQELPYWELPAPSLNLVRDGQPTDSMFQDPYTEDELKAAEKMLA